MKIIFTGDFMRPAASHWRPTQHYNIRWLHDLFAGMLHRLGADDVSYLAWNQDGVTRGGLEGADIAAWYAMAGTPCDMPGWGTLYGRHYLPVGFRQAVAARFAGAFVIGFEIPPFLKSILIESGTPYLDFVIHPVRFHDDLFFGIQASDPGLDTILRAHALDEDELYAVASVVRATAGRLSHSQSPVPFELFLMQTRHDKTQIRCGRFVGATDFLETAIQRGLLAGEVLLKPHPLEPSNPHIRALEAALPQGRRTTTNFYELLADERLSRVLSLSSSTSLEARYFGAEAHFLYREPYAITYRGDAASRHQDAYVSVKDSYFSLAFWAAVLEQAGVVAASPPRTARLDSKPNRLRTALKSFWNFNVVNTDIAVATYQPPPPGR